MLNSAVPASNKRVRYVLGNRSGMMVLTFEIQRISGIYGKTLDPGCSIIHHTRLAIATRHPSAERDAVMLPIQTALTETSPLGHSFVFFVVDEHIQTCELHGVHMHIRAPGFKRRIPCNRTIKPGLEDRTTHWDSNHSKANTM